MVCFSIYINYYYSCLEIKSHSLKKEGGMINMGKINIEIKITDGEPVCKYAHKEATLEELSLVVVQLELLKTRFLKNAEEKMTIAEGQ